jgi:hypothetical protein
MSSDDDADQSSEFRKVLKQIRPEDRRAVRWWLIEGLSFGEKHSREAREGMSKYHEEAARMTELLEPLIKDYEELLSAYNMLLGMDLESERLSELNEQR